MPGPVWPWCPMVPSQSSPVLPFQGQNGPSGSLGGSAALPPRAAHAWCWPQVPGPVQGSLGLQLDPGQGEVSGSGPGTILDQAGGRSGDFAPEIQTTGQSVLDRFRSRRVKKKNQKIQCESYFLSARSGRGLSWHLFAEAQGRPRPVTSSCPSSQPARPCRWPAPPQPGRAASGARRAPPWHQPREPTQASGGSRPWLAFVWPQTLGREPPPQGPEPAWHPRCSRSFLV